MNRKPQSLVSTALIVIVSMALVSCIAPVEAGGGPQTTADNPRTIQLSATGTATAAPDLANIYLGVESINEDAEAAVNDNAERSAAVMDALAALDIAAGDIQTVNFSMWVESVYDDEGQPTGQVRYHVTNQFSVRLRDIGRTGEVLGAALQAGANNVHGISFTVSDPLALQQQARDIAIANARAKAEQLANGFEAQLAGVRQVIEYSDDMTPVPAPYMPERGGMGGGGQVAISPGEFSVLVRIEVIFNLAE